MFSALTKALGGAVVGEAKEVPETWERNEDVNLCRQCYKEFTVAFRRHHCRNCGGIFCEECCVYELESGRACGGCGRAETPGKDIELHAFQIINRGVSGAAEIRRTPGRAFALEYGPFRVHPGQAAPSYGTFEFINKSDKVGISPYGRCLSQQISNYYILNLMCYLFLGHLRETQHWRRLYLGIHTAFVLCFTTKRSFKWQISW